MIIYQFSNSIQIFFIVSFSILLLIGIIVSIVAFPLLKFVFQNDNPIKARIMLFFVTIAIYTFSLSISFLSAKNIVQYHSTIVETNINHCSVTTGEIQSLEKMPQYARGATLTSYHLKCRIDDVEYYIDTDVGVTLENIDLWSEGNNVTIYFNSVDGKNIIIRAIKN